jgi:hypothetical protein
VIDEFAEHRRAWTQSDATIDALALDAPGHVSCWPRPDVQWFNVLGRILTQTSRHAGHADILREQLDGVVEHAALDELGSVGVRPVSSLNAALNADSEVYPTRKAIFVTGVSPAASSSIALNTRIRRRTACQVMPVSSAKRRASVRGARPTSSATSSKRS